jgi:membrane protein DedA with SNARE-associated domain
VEWWDEVRLALQTFLDHHGVVAGFVLILVEEAGVPVPVPGDFLMLGLGAHAREGRVSLWGALLVMEAATLLGASILYFVSRRAGRNLVYRYGRYMHLTPERLERARSWLERRGSLAIVLGRVTPGLRIPTVIASGVFGVPYWRFLPSLAIGGFAYILLYTLLGYFFGPAVLGLLEGIHLPLGLLGSLVPLVVLTVWIVRARRGLHLARHTEASGMDRHHRWRDGAVAGVLATVVSTLTLNVVVHLSGDLALVAPGDLVAHARARLAVLALVRVVGPVLLLLAVPAFILVGAVWGAVYAEWVEPRLHYPDWLSGLAFAFLPLGVALVVVLPLLDSAAPRLEPLGPLAATSEAIRHMVYGAALGLIYPLRLARRSRPVRGADHSGLPASTAPATSGSWPAA